MRPPCISTICLAMARPRPVPPLACSRQCSPRVGKLDGIPYEIEEYLREALFVPEANRERLVHISLERELLILRQRLGGRPHRLDHALNCVLGHVQGELAGFDL